MLLVYDYMGDVLSERYEIRTYNMVILVTLEVWISSARFTLAVPGGNLAVSV